MARSIAALELRIKGLQETNEDLQKTLEGLGREMAEVERELCMMENERDDALTRARDMCEELEECQRICEPLQQEYYCLSNRDNFKLREEIGEKDLTIAKLQSQADILRAKSEAAAADYAVQRLSAEAAFDKLTADYNTLKG